MTFDAALRRTAGDEAPSISCEEHELQSISKGYYSHTESVESLDLY